MSGRRDFLEILRELSEVHNLCMETSASGWIIKIASSESNYTYIYGYNFDLNCSASQQICGDKNATSEVLAKAGVPCIQHEAFMNPAEPLVCNYIPESGSICAILKYAQQFNFNVVVKPLKGTGGADVFHASCPREIESAVIQVWRKDYGVAIAPFVEIVNEIRVVVLRGKSKLMYRKQRRCITGDGINTVKQLIGSALGESSISKSSIINSFSAMSDERLSYIPSVSEELPIEWRHNLGLGAVAELCFDPKVQALAVSAAQILKLDFCSVDIVETIGGTHSVLEVNSGVMMDSFLGSNSDYRSIAKAIYEEAILYALLE